MVSISSGTGVKLATAVIYVAGAAALVATLLSFVSIWLQSKNYRKPLLQRYVIRILVMVPIYSISSWCSILSTEAAFYVEPIRDIYEAFTIYTFFQLLINFIGGERALIIMMNGREPVNHLWPLNHCLPKVDISDPHTFLAVKRGILQYAWLKPFLGLATIIMKSTGVYTEGNLGLTSGYLWSGILYNLSVTISLYSLGLFWVIMSKDLKPFRPMPKFLCIKLIIFASYWQGFFLSILVYFGAIPDDVEGYTPDNLAAAIQDALICCEMPLFAIAHWYAFSWHDYADVTISAARMPVTYAFRDAFGIRDLIEDTKETFSGNKYEYRLFDSGDNVLGHEESVSRVRKMKEGMRYERGGKGKYWIPKPGEVNARTPLLADSAGTSRKGSMHPDDTDSFGEGPSGEPVLDPGDERLYQSAKRLEFGDWNYPVITANEASRERWLTQSPDLTTTSTNRNLLQPTDDHRIRRKSNIRETVEAVTNKGKSKQRETSSSGHRNGKSQHSANADGKEGRAPLPKGMLRHHSSASSSAKSDRSQLVDLVVEDMNAEDIERVRARKEGSSAWNDVEPKRYVRTYPGEGQGEDIRQGFEPADDSGVIAPKSGNEGNEPAAENDNDDNNRRSDDDSEETRHWKEARHSAFLLKPKYGTSLEVNVWAGDEPSEPPRENS